MEEITNNGIGLALSVRREKFWHFSGILWLSRAFTRTKFPTQLPGTLTHPLALADLASGSTIPNFLLLKPPLSDHRHSLTVTNSCLFNALGPCLSSSSGRVGNLARKPFVFRAKTDKGILWLALTHTHRTNAHHRATVFLIFYWEFFLSRLVTLTSLPYNLPITNG